MTEDWRPVVGFEGLYEVSNLGRVRSLDRVNSYSRTCQYSGRILNVKRKYKGRLLRPGTASNGYMTVSLGRSNSVCVHVLVLTAFAGPAPTGTECLHRDGTRTNNNAENLRWGTRSENILDAIRHGTRSYSP